MIDQYSGGLTSEQRRRMDEALNFLRHQQASNGTSGSQNPSSDSFGGGLGKVCYNTLLAFAQLVVMFLWGWAVFKLDLWSHIPGFIIMGVSTAFAVAAFGILLASACKTSRKPCRKRGC